MSGDFDNYIGDSMFDPSDGLDNDLLDRLEELRENAEQGELDKFDQYRITQRLGLEGAIWSDPPTGSGRGPDSRPRQRRSGDLEPVEPGTVPLPESGFGPNARHVEPGRRREPGTTRDIGPDADAGRKDARGDGDGRRVRGGDEPGRDDGEFQSRGTRGATKRGIELANAREIGRADPGAQVARILRPTVTKKLGFQKAIFEAMIHEVKYVSTGELAISLRVPVDVEEAQKLGGAYGLSLQVMVVRKRYAQSLPELGELWMNPKS